MNGPGGQVGQGQARQHRGQHQGQGQGDRQGQRQAPYLSEGSARAHRPPNRPVSSSLAQRARGPRKMSGEGGGPRGSGPIGPDKDPYADSWPHGYPGRRLTAVWRLYLSEGSDRPQEGPQDPRGQGRQGPSRKVKPPATEGSTRRPPLFRPAPKSGTRRGVVASEGSDVPLFSAKPNSQTSGGVAASEGSARSDSPYTTPHPAPGGRRGSNTSEGSDGTPTFEGQVMGVDLSEPSDSLVDPVQPDGTPCPSDPSAAIADLQWVALKLVFATALIVGVLVWL